MVAHARAGEVLTHRLLSPTFRILQAGDVLCPIDAEVSSLVLPSGPIGPWAADAHGRMSAGPASR